MSRNRHRCDYCEQSLRKVDIAPMLHDDIWVHIASKRAKLCGPGMFKLAHHKGIKLTPADLRPCVFNLHRTIPVGLRRRSWFDLFRTTSKADPPGNRIPRVVLATIQCRAEIPRI
jgi:hypothetical protein